MEFTGLGGGVMLAIAAALWLLYLLPNWLKNREYMATEKNAVRLQQTIRVLAETSLAETRDARMSANAQQDSTNSSQQQQQYQTQQQQQQYQTQQRQQQARARQARYAGPVAVGVPVRVRVVPSSQRARARLRRTRVLTALILLAAIVIGIVQIGLMIGVGAVGASWLVLGTATLGAFSSVAMLSKLAEVARSRRAPVAAGVVRRTSLGERTAPVVAPAAGWTPVPLPKPLYLSRSAAPASAVGNPVLELELAAASAERALRLVQQPPGIVPRSPAASASPFAAMGIVDVTSTTAPDLDAVLARRRAAG
jgi:hypothetical protein